ncbi:MAG: NAD(P)-dependent oxidoreductase [Chloroflexota bacterium]|nr:MAG: NAD(P)-dependent oxidoreductase [Chloroflexota bacterium]
MIEATMRRHVLVTGSTGAIGLPLTRHLVERGHAARGFARRPTPELRDHVVGDLADRDAVRRATDGVDTVVHLGAYPNSADFINALLGPNVVGLYHVCEAAVEFGVKRLILASSVQVTTGHAQRERPVTVEDGPMPINHYALTKAWAELAGDMYARVHDLSVISVRIGWFPRNTEEARRLAKSAFGPNIFLSHRDANRFFACCVESPNPDAGSSVVLQAASRPVTIGRMDIGPARDVIGYEPGDTWPEGLPFPID